MVYVYGIMWSAICFVWNLSEMPTFSLALSLSLSQHTSAQTKKKINIKFDRNKHTNQIPSRDFITAAWWRKRIEKRMRAKYTDSSNLNTNYDMCMQNRNEDIDRAERRQSK